MEGQSVPLSLFIQHQHQETLTSCILKRKGDQNATKRNLDYWINLAKLLDRGGFDMLFLADTYGGYDTYQGSLDECIRRGAQWPVLDPIIVSAVLTPKRQDPSSGPH